MLREVKYIAQRTWTRASFEGGRSAKSTYLRRESYIPLLFLLVFRCSFAWFLWKNFTVRTCGERRAASSLRGLLVTWCVGVANVYLFSFFTFLPGAVRSCLFMYAGVYGLLCTVKGKTKEYRIVSGCACKFEAALGLCFVDLSCRVIVRKRSYLKIDSFLTNSETVRKIEQIYK